MRLTVELHPSRETKKIELPDRADGIALMGKLGLAPDVHILVRGDVPIPIDEELRDGERLRVISVVSGG